MSAAAVKAFGRRLARLERVPERLGPAAAPGVLAAARASAAAGTAPDGTAWPAKEEGGRALRGAAGALSAEGLADGVRVTLTGPEVYHHTGAGGAPRRQILPDDGQVPAAYARAVDAAFDREVAKALGGAG